MRLCYTNRARDDIELAFSWYEKQRQGLGFEFLNCVEAALRNIVEFPEMHQMRYSFMLSWLCDKKVSFHYILYD